MKNIIFKKNYFIPLCIFFVFTILCLGGIFYPAGYNFLPANSILESFLLFLVFLNFGTINKKISFFILLSGLYIIITSSLAVYRNINILDYLMAYKSFIYIIILSFFVDKKIFDLNFVNKFFTILCLFFMVKYLYMNILLIDHRPGLFTENNFELMLLAIIFYLKTILNDKVILFDIVMLFLLFILSGSRSGIVIFAFVLFMIYGIKFDKKMIFKIFLFGLLLIIIYFIFLERSGGAIDINKIDRFMFLTNFINDVSEWNFFDYLTGTQVLTPMSDQTCQNLSYYSSLFSYKNDGVCYSVILHSYILRAIYDHGILGLSFVFYFYYKALRISGYKFLQTLTFIGIPLLNSISVSAFNSIYFAFAILIVLSAKMDKK